MPLFQPRGVKSERQSVVDYVAKANYGDLVHYDDLCSLLGGKDRQAMQSVVNQAKPSLERAHQIALIPVRGSGYRIAHPAEHLGLAKQHQRKSRRSLGRSHSKVQNVDLSKLTPGEKAAVTLAAASLSAQMDYMRRNDIRVGRLEAAAQEVAVKSEKSAEDISALQARLARLEQAISS